MPKRISLASSRTGGLKQTHWAESFIARRDIRSSIGGERLCIACAQPGLVEHMRGVAEKRRQTSQTPNAQLSRSATQKRNWTHIREWEQFGNSDSISEQTYRRTICLDSSIARLSRLPEAWTFLFSMPCGFGVASECRVRGIGIKQSWSEFRAEDSQSATGVVDATF
jgi:hypothetical protein